MTHSYKVWAVCNLCKLHVEAEAHVLNHVNSNSLHLSFSIKTILSSNVPDDGIGLSDLVLT